MNIKQQEAAAVMFFFADLEAPCGRCLVVAEKAEMIVPGVMGPGPICSDCVNPQWAEGGEQWVLARMDRIRAGLDA